MAKSLLLDQGVIRCLEIGTEGRGYNCSRFVIRGSALCGVAERPAFAPSRAAGQHDHVGFRAVRAQG